MNTRQYQSFFQFLLWIILPAWLLQGAMPCQAQIVPTTNHFACQLSQDFSNSSWDGGRAFFRIECDQLHFTVHLQDMFKGFSGAVLLTDSRQVRIDTGPGTFALLPTCDPVLVSGSNEPPAWISCDGLTAVQIYSGTIPLNETLLRELLTGLGELRFFMPSTRAGDMWNVPPPVAGRLLRVPGSDPTNAAACLPRHARSVSASYGFGPVNVPPVDFFPSFLDLNNDGVHDFALTGTTLCTLSIPGSCTTMFTVGCLSSNQLLVEGWAPSVFRPGQQIGSVAPTNTAWGTPGMDSLTSYGSGEAYRPWTGGLGGLGEGYLGAKLRLADGDHFGWIRIRLPAGRFVPIPSSPAIGEFGPVVEDWAFEPEPGKPITTGAKAFVVGSQILPTSTPNRLRVSFPTDTGRAYQLQQRPSLGAGGWSNFGFNFIGSGAPQTIELPTTGSSGFFRLLEAD